MSSHSLAPLRNSNFRLLLAGFAIGQMLMPLQFVTQILWVQHYAPDTYWLILVALIGASRGSGALLFGLYGGALADRFDRRTLLMAIQTLLVLCTVAISLLMWFSVGGWLGFSLFFLLTFVSAGLLAIDAPTRLAIVPDILGAELTPAGLSINQVAAQLAMPMAMLATGFVVAAFGYSGAYLFSALGPVFAILFLARMTYRAQLDQDNERPGVYGLRQTLSDVREGLSYARGNTVVFWTILLMVTMMSAGFPATANLGPTWITTVVGVEVQYFGFVAVTWGIGSLIAAVLLTRYAQVQRRGLLIAVGAVLFSVSFVVFVGEATVLNAVVGNLGLGAGMTLAMISSTILIQRIVPNRVRGRVMSILQLNMGFAQLMTMPIALLAQWFGLPLVLQTLSWVTLIAVVAIVVLRPQVRQATV